MSTRGEAPAVSVEEAVLAGLAPDGGLYVPEAFPKWSAATLRAWRGRPWAEVATDVLQPFFAPWLDARTLRELVDDAAATFGHPEVAPLRRLSSGIHLLELFHGPTLAFKDVALQLVGRLFARLLAERGRTGLVLGATSGDTGSAAIAGCAGRPGLRVVILHPAGRPSEVQRRQMTTVADPGVLNLAVAGSFDDCQDLVKAAFRDPDLRADVGLLAVNSINVARVLAQVVYYVTAATALGAPDEEVAFTVPTGNFGDALAGAWAARMGLPIRRLVVATNANDLLARTLLTGAYEPGEVVPTLSPSMDIQVASNFERLLFELWDRDPRRVRDAFARLRAEGSFRLGDTAHAAARQLLDAGAADDAATSAAISSAWETDGILVDPHTAVGLHVAARVEVGPGPHVVLATAHPAKFPDAVLAATGQHPALPPALSDLMERTERMEALTVSSAALASRVRAHARR